MSTIVPAVGAGGSAGISAGTVLAKGDLLVATGPGAVARIAAGVVGQVLVVDPTTSTGLRWATPSSSSIPAGLGLAPLGTSPLGS